MLRRNAREKMQLGAKVDALEAENLLLQNKHKALQKLLNHAPAMLAYWDKDLKNGFGNDAYQEWFGISPKEMYGKTLKEVIGDHLFSLNLLHIHGALAGELQKFERAMQDANGNNRFTQVIYSPDIVDGAVLGFYVQVADITERQRELEQLNALTATLQAIYDNLPFIAWMKDKNGRYLHANKRWLDSAGIQDIQSVRGLTDFDVWPRELAEQYQSIDHEVMATRQQKRVIERSLDHDREFWVETHKAVVVGENDEILGTTGFALDITEQIEYELRLKNANTVLRDFSASIQKAREDERKHIARELHDELGQWLTGTRLQVGILNMQFARNNPEMHAHVNEIIDTLDKTIEVVRNVSSNLRPGILNSGILIALEWLAESFTTNTGVGCVLDFDADSLHLDDDSAIVVFRIVQESLTNIAKHAIASEVSIAMQSHPDCLRFEVLDNGKGFDLANVNQHESFGIIGMKERALMVGGELIIESAEKTGCKVSLKVPIRPD